VRGPVCPSRMKKIDVTGEDVIIVFSRETNIKGWLVDTSEWRALIIKPVKERR